MCAFLPRNWQPLLHTEASRKPISALWQAKGSMLPRGGNSCRTISHDAAVRKSQNRRRWSSQAGNLPPARIGPGSESTAQVPPLLLDIHQLAKALAVSRTTVENWTRSRRIPSLKIGRVLRYDLQKVLAALAAYERKAIEF